MARATFHKNKIRDIELSFDSLSWTRQLQALGMLDLGLIRAEDDVAGELPLSAQASSKSAARPQHARQAGAASPARRLAKAAQSSTPTMCFAAAAIAATSSGRWSSDGQRRRSSGSATAPVCSRYE